MNTIQYLDEAKRVKGFTSDYQLSKALGWGRQKISNYRNLPQHMDNEAAREYAEFMGLPVFEVIANMEVQRAKDSGHKKAWERLAKLSKQAAFASPNMLILLSISSFIQYIVYYVK